MLSFHKLLVISWRHSDDTFLIPCIADITAQRVIDIFTNWIKSTVGYPNSLVTDQDSLFMLKLFQDWMAGVGIMHQVSSTYHPQTDGASERKNRTIIPMLSTKKLEEGKIWVKAAPEVQCLLNLRESGPRGQLPFLTLLGLRPKMQGSFLPHPVLVHSDPAKRHYQAAENLTSAKHQQILPANKHRRIGTPYKVGQQVKLSTENLPDRYHVSKISPR